MTNLHPMLEPYRPIASDPFDSCKAAHLLSRAGFGGTPDEIAQVLQLGPHRAVERLLDFPDLPAEQQTPDDVPDLRSIADYPDSFRELRTMVAQKTPEQRKEFRRMLATANREALTHTVGWWLYRMAHGPHPLQEKLALFWHGHFTTSARDERSAALMWQQNELLRRMAAGDFRHLLHEISRDPAMLDYLNNTQNHKRHPNENYARELMELFTLGIGNYTENDVKAAARAFTGWTHDGEQFLVRRQDHDDGIKTYLGRSGHFDGDDIVDIIAATPACARFISGEMFAFFAYDNPDPAIVESLAAVLRQNDYQMRPMLRILLNSRAFYSRLAIGTQIKCPVQLLVGTARLLGVELPRTSAMAGALSQMGQVPFMPPNVRGWPGGRAWINTSTLLIRYNTAVFLAGQTMPVLTGLGGRRGNLRQRPVAPPAFAPDVGGSAAQVVDYWVDRLIQRPLDAQRRRVLIESLGAGPLREGDERRMVQLIVSMPEFQLC